MLVHGSRMGCTRRIPQLSISLGNYSFIEFYYVARIGVVTDVVLGLQRLKSLGRSVQGFNKMELEFTYMG